MLREVMHYSTIGTQMVIRKVFNLVFLSQKCSQYHGVDEESYVKTNSKKVRNSS